MRTLFRRPPKVETAFSDTQLYGFRHWLAPGRMAERLNLPRALAMRGIGAKVR